MDSFLMSFSLSDKSLLAAYIFAPLAILYVFGFVAELFSLASNAIHQMHASVPCHEKATFNRKHSLLKNEQKYPGLRGIVWVNLPDLPSRLVA